MPQAKSLNCPSCGGTLDVANWFVRMVVCRYCGSTVAIENERDAIGVAAQNLQMALAERGAEHGDAIRDAVLMGHQAIGVAFHHDRAAVFEMIACDVESVEFAAFGKQRSFGRIDVLGRMVVR